MRVSVPQSTERIVKSIPRAKIESEIGQSAFNVKLCIWCQTAIAYSRLCLHVNKRCASSKRLANFVVIGRNGWYRDARSLYGQKINTEMI